MGRREVFERYTNLDPRASRYIPPRVGWSLTEGRTFLDALTYDAVIWHPYVSHTRTCPFMAISMFSRWIRLSDMIHRHLPERVLQHAITSVVEAHKPYACVDGYIAWFRQVSHPYNTPGDDDE
ncbi:uncharacterized protein LOC124838312 [Vigna umbellata]|uniref:uncharacterized protein LOC124838312 n=1 Tax=Vigna umbellata TaxID=87088 RepID=UPI001F5EF72A|nr:uncharacterized protein LOC124838312 [Vigna umbellata]